MRKNKNQRKRISGELNDRDIALLLQAAADNDRTLRIYASEFLYDLGDPRAIDAAATIFPLANDNGRYNIILVLTGTVNDVSPQQKSRLVGMLRLWRGMVGNRTQALIDKLLGQLR